jgi:hypothetical protein
MYSNIFEFNVQVISFLPPTKVNGLAPYKLQTKGSMS